MRKLPTSLQPDILAAAPIMTVGVGFHCPVEVPLGRSGTNAGMTISIAETAKGPALVIMLADKDGRALAGAVTADAFPGFLNLMTTQCQRMRDLMTPPADPEKPE